MNKESKELILKFLNRMTGEINKAVEDIVAMPETEAPTMERQHDNHDNDALRYQMGKKDWEILEFKSTTSPYEVIVRLKEVMSKEDWTNYYLESVKRGSHVIHSVRRLSDNTVWTVGDRCNQGIINEFQILDGKLWAKGIGFRVNFLGDELDARFKQPLFTTADGRSVTVGDEIYVIAYEVGQITHCRAGVGLDYNFYYSTREAARKAYSHWKMEQPVLSMKDIVKFVNDQGAWEDISEIVKEKLAQR